MISLILVNLNNFTAVLCNVLVFYKNILKYIAEKTRLLVFHCKY